MPLYTLAVVDRHGHGLPVVQALLTREDQQHIQLFLASAFRLAGNNMDVDNCVFVLDKDFAEINAVKASFPNVKIILCRFHVLKAIHDELHKLHVTSEEKDELMKVCSTFYNTSSVSVLC